MTEDLDNQVATLKELARLQKKAAAGVVPVSSEMLHDTLSQRKVPHTMAITSGKGGVGKTLVTVNLAVQYARKGLKVLLIDADLGLANIDVVLGLNPLYTIQDVLSGQMTLEQVAIQGPFGITVLPAASGVAELSDMNEGQRTALMDHIDQWNADFDIVLVDTGAGISPNVRFFVLAVERIMVVATPDPASVTDAYALMKVMFNNHRVSHFDLVVNQVKNSAEAKDVYRTLSRVAEKYLNIGLNYAGFIPDDLMLVQAVRQRKTVSELYPSAPSSLAFGQLAENLMRILQQKRQDDGRMVFFWRRLLEESVRKAAAARLSSSA
ncbi:MinD/ParA family protein [Candidatus Magnetaquicoccus inordinatus]|uniref:MinD/ParA family protein n=1 Tax=Candidatus Magnetaquicoccus inordinatus TaxID=2496818 RepID=UPI00102CF9A8|nr:MinD/ParA family protein [Candidatus Magnetaquicoccus inordinatus]